MLLSISPKENRKSNVIFPLKRLSLWSQVSPTVKAQYAEKVIKEQLANKDKQLKLVEDMLGDIKLN